MSIGHGRFTVTASNDPQPQVIEGLVFDGQNGDIRIKDADTGVVRVIDAENLLPPGQFNPIRATHVLPYGDVDELTITAYY